MPRHGSWIAWPSCRSSQALRSFAETNADSETKPPCSMSNSPWILHALPRRCEGLSGECSRPDGGKHSICSGSICKDMAKYPRELCRAVLRGLTAQLRSDKRIIAGCYGLQAEDEDNIVAEIAEHVYGPAQGYSGKYKDDLTGQALRDDLVKLARAKELEFFCSKGVWLKVPRQRSYERTGKPPISVRWVDVSKGGGLNPGYRSRLVARGIRFPGGDAVFAPTSHWKRCVSYWV